MTLDGGHSEMTIDEEPLARSVLDVALAGLQKNHDFFCKNQKNRIYLI